MNSTARTKIETIENRIKQYDGASGKMLDNIGRAVTGRKRQTKNYSFSIKAIVVEGDKPLVICERATGWMNYNKFMEFALTRNPYIIIYDEFDGDSPESKKQSHLSAKINMMDDDDENLSGIDDEYEEADDEVVKYEETPLQRKLNELSAAVPEEKMMSQREVKRMLRESNNGALGKLQEAMESIEKQKHLLEMDDLRRTSDWEKRHLQERIDELERKRSKLEEEKQKLEKEIEELESENEDLAAKVKDFEEGGTIGRFSTTAEKLLPVIGPALAGLFPGLKGLGGPQEQGLPQPSNAGRSPRQDDMDAVISFMSNIDDVALSDFMFVVSRMMVDNGNIAIVRDLLSQ